MRRSLLIVLLLALALSGCTTANYEWLGRNICGAGLSRRETGCGGTLCPNALRRRGMPHPIRWSLGLLLCWCAAGAGPGDSCL